MKSRFAVKLLLGTLIALPAIAVVPGVARNAFFFRNAPAQGARPGVPTDPWGSPIQFETVVGEDGATHVRAWSLGPDRTPDSGDEVYGEFKRQPRAITRPEPPETP